MAIEDLTADEFDGYVKLYGKAATPIILTMTSMLETLEESGEDNTEMLDYSSGEAMKASIESLFRIAIDTYKVSAEFKHLLERT